MPRSTASICAAIAQSSSYGLQGHSGLVPPARAMRHCAVQTLRSAGPVRVGVFCASFLPALAEALRSPTADYRACECLFVQFSS